VRRFLASAGLSAILALSACSKEQTTSAPVQYKTFPANSLGKSLKVSVLDSDHPAVNAQENSTTQSVQVEFTVQKEPLLNQEFLYGADIQYSTIHEENLNLYLQSLALGHIPARFRIAGNELQLVTDNRRLSPSDVNHPERLIARYKILSQTPAVQATETSPAIPATLTIAAGNSSVTLAELSAGLKAQGEDGSLEAFQLPSPRDHWIRSFDYIPDGSYILQQTSLVLSDGNTIEFMESIMPRSTLAPGPQFEKIAMDPDHPAGGATGIPARFRLLNGETIYEGEKAVSYAQHFDISPKLDGTPTTIDFYVTQSIPDEYLTAVGAAVEGWNRYFEMQKGIQRKVVRFKGKLPDGIALGDPRYNVINWDNRTDAGAAYESQANDPHTGVQSHSLIYLPAAWLRIGADYWRSGQFADPALDNFGKSLLSKREGAFRSPRLSCLRNIKEETLLGISGRLSREDVHTFSVEMVKQTLFHEVGHALGLGHNFKGSLAYNRSDSNPMFSTSIMDYNDYEIERSIFNSLESYQGPQLEYDRQVLSALYNHSRDIRSNDPVIPTCNDTEADQEEGGVDPLCVRYDIENDPTLSVQTAYNRVMERNIKGDVTLAEALVRAGSAAMDSELLASVKTEEDLTRFLGQVKTTLRGTLAFYLTAGKASLAKTAVTNIKSLLMFQDGILPEKYDAKQMRKRAMWGVNTTVALNQLPEFLQDSIEKVITATQVALERTPLVQNMSRERVHTVNDAVQNYLVNTVKEFEKDEKQGLPRLRAVVLKGLNRHKHVPFYFEKGFFAGTDIEANVIRLLADTAANVTNTFTERFMAVASLKTFEGRFMWSDHLIRETRESILSERENARDNKTRERVLALASLFGQNSSLLLVE
jgi:hypothetical protein